MKKFIITGLAMTVMFASCLDNDDSDDVGIGEGSNRCFNIYDDKGDSSHQSITTKISQQDFTLYRKKLLTCNIPMVKWTENEKCTLIDMNSGETIKDNDGNIIEEKCDSDNVTFNVPNIYKNVKVHISYDLKTRSGWTTKTEHKEENSTDNFAIRPYEFNITLRKKSLKVGENTPLYLEVIDYKNNIINEYSKSSIELEANATDNVPVQYSFDIKNGKSLPSGIIQFLKDKDDISVIFRDTKFATIDDDDTKNSCKDINGTVNNIKIIKNYKSWAGSSTENSSNNPQNKTINSKIKQNQNRDLHFQKMGW